MSNILIFGTGNVGSVYACILNRGGARITCVCRSAFDEVRAHGIKVVSPILGALRSRPIVVHNVAEAVSASRKPFDYVIICTKAVSPIPSVVVELIASAVTPGITAIVLIQNGLGVERQYHTQFPEATIISGVAYLPTTQISPAVFSHSEIERLHLGLYPAKQHSVKAAMRLGLLVDLIEKGGATAIREEDVQCERWRKVVANGAVNPICALSRCRDRELMSIAPLASDCLRGVMLEIASVAKAAGYGHTINDDTVEKQFGRSLSRPYPGVQPSMLADVMESKPLEVEAILGEVVRIARKNGIEVHRLEVLLVLLQGLDWKSQSRQTQEGLNTH